MNGLLQHKKPTRITHTQSLIATLWALIMFVRTHNKELARARERERSLEMTTRKCEKRQPIRNNHIHIEWMEKKREKKNCTVNYLALAHFYVCAHSLITALSRPYI